MENAPVPPAADPHPAEPQADLSPHLQAIVQFVLLNTTLVSLPHVPELSLRLGHDSVALWHKVDGFLGRSSAAPPYWAFAWAGGQTLARYLLDRPELVAGRRVLDLGCGSGVAAIAAAKAGAASVLANDIDFFAGIAAALNADVNAVELQVNALDLLSDTTAFSPSEIDLVLACDVFYDAGIGARALAFLHRCRAAGARVLVGDPGREWLPQELLTRRFEDAVEVARGFQYAAAGMRSTESEFKLAYVFEFLAA
jgi:predicted nicotinamide N-methyase